MSRGRFLRVLLRGCAGALSAAVFAPAALAADSSQYAPGPALFSSRSLYVPGPDPAPPFIVTDLRADAPQVSLAQAGTPSQVQNPPGKAQDKPKKTPTKSEPLIDQENYGGVASNGSALNVESLAFNEVDFSSPIYTTFKRQLFGTTEFNVSAVTLDVYTGGKKIGAESISQIQLVQVWRYGVTDDLSLEASISESPSSINKETIGGTSARTVSQGWENPGLIAVYRAFSEQNSPVYADLTGEYYPNVFTQVQNTTFGFTGGASDVRASPAAHAQEAIFEESVGHSFGKLTLEGIAETIWNGEVHGMSGTSPSYWNEQYEVEAFYRFNERWSGSTDIEYQLDGRNGGPFFAHAQFNYYLIPDKLQATLDYEHAFSFNEEPSPAAIAARHVQSNIVGIRLGYSFDVGPN